MHGACLEDGEATATPDAEPEATAEPEAESDAAAAEEFEGPRRRARRERELRREAQARAIAIEQARRDAKRRAQGKPAEDAKTVGRGTVRGLKVAVWTVALVVAFVGLGLLLYFTPIMAARNVVITGLGSVTQDEIIAAAGVKQGTPLLQVNTDHAPEPDDGKIITGCLVRKIRCMPENTAKPSSANSAPR